MSSVTAIIQMINKFGVLSGYKVNYGKSLALPLGNLSCSDLSTYIPFQLFPNGIRSLCFLKPS